ncbi:MAG: PrsW family glutamic-type intramembrane protease [Dermatophilaceae bacterium]
MLLLMAAAAVVSVAQLALVGSWARSVRVSTLLMAVAVGAYACGTVTVLIQVAWTRLLSFATDRPLPDIVEVASYTADPVIEEIVKLAPLVVLGWRWRMTHRQLGLTDHLLASVALGAGFELFEAALRFSSLGAVATSVPGGYLVAGNLGGTVTVPSLWESLTSWQPVPAAFEELFASGGDTVQHLVWTGLAGLGFGWVFRRGDAWRWLGLAGVAVACADHANYNLRAVADDVPSILVPPSAVVAWVGSLLSTILVLALAGAVAADRLTLAGARARRHELLLDGEVASGLGMGPLVRRATTGAPWSTYATWRFVLARRAVMYGSAAGVDELVVSVTVAEERALLERARSGPAWTVAGRRFTGRLREVLAPRRLVTPVSVLWLIALTPAVLYLVIGAFPATSALQRWLRGPVGLALFVGCAVVGAAMLALQLRQASVGLRRLPASSLHDLRLRGQERVVIAGGGRLPSFRWCCSRWPGGTGSAGWCRTTTRSTRSAPRSSSPAWRSSSPPCSSSLRSGWP